MDYSQIMIDSVNLTVNNLTDGEVSALFLATQLGGIKPYHKGFEKLSSLMTEPNGGMHSATLEALIECLQIRVSKFHDNCQV